MNQKYGPDIRYDDVGVGFAFPPRTVSITDDLAEQYKDTTGGGEDDLFGIIFLHRFIYTALGGQFPDGNLHTHLAFKSQKRIHPGETYSLSAIVADKFVKRQWKYLSFDITWSDADGGVIAVLGATHAVEREEIDA